MLKYLVIGNTPLFWGQTKDNYPKMLNIGTSLFPLGILSLVYDDYHQVDLLQLQRIDGDVEKLAEFINNYNVLIMPLQDKLKAENAGYFNLLNRLIPKLKCKICLASIGVHPDNELNSMTEKDKDKFKTFFTLIFNRCKTINVRGEISKDFVVSLGFPEDRIKVLGCPSMYGFGPEFHIKNKQISPNSYLVVSENITKPEYLYLDNVNKFFESNIKRFDSWKYIMTRDFEAKTLKSINDTAKLPVVNNRWWKQVLDKHLKKGGDIYKGFENAVYPLNIISWMNLLENKEFCLSSRIHSAIMAMLCGIPTLVVCIDTRMEELCKVHNIPHVLGQNVDENTNVFDLIKNIDFNEINKTQKEKFWQYIDFLNENGVETIYDGGKMPEKNFFLESLKTTQNENLVMRLK